VDFDEEVKPKNPDDAFIILLDPSKTKKDFGWEFFFLSYT